MNSSFGALYSNLSRKNITLLLQVNDIDFSITLNAYFITKWQDQRLQVTYLKRNRTSRGRGTTTTKRPPQLTGLGPDASDIDPNKLTAVNLQILRNLWLPDVEILNLKAFETHHVLSKLEGIWIDGNHNFIYVLAARITFICPMKFNAFPMDIQKCKFQVGHI